MRLALLFVIAAYYSVPAYSLTAERRGYNLEQHHQLDDHQLQHHELQHHQLEYRQLDDQQPVEVNPSEIRLFPQDSLKIQNKEVKTKSKLNKGKHQKFWLKALFALSVTCVAVGLGSMFFVASLGWWVILTALFGILLGVGIMYIAEKKSGSKVAGLGTLGLGSLSIILWWLGILGVLMFIATP
ncbi:MAG: hypothetical protein WDZ35_15080 [Crocinitomicaceae bacterium]